MSYPVEINETASARDTIKAVIDGSYDIVLLDMAFPDGTGLDVLSQICLACPDTRVLFLSMYPEEQYARRVLKSGAAGYLTKDSAPSELIAAIEKVMAGGKYVTLSLAEALAEALVSPQTQRPHETLSDREFQVLIAIGQGSSISEIAANLALSPQTISTYRSRILRKLSLNNTAEIIRYVLDMGL
jgi:DNA-binding NarL/FixJ family response regulator